MYFFTNIFIPLLKIDETILLSLEKENKKLKVRMPFSVIS